MHINFVVMAHDENGNPYAYADRIGGNSDILLPLIEQHRLNPARGDRVFIFSSKKEAERVAETWNEAFQHNRRKG